VNNKIYLFLLISFLIHCAVILNIQVRELKFYKNETYIEVSFIGKKNVAGESYKLDRSKASSNIQKVLKESQESKSEKRKVFFADNKDRAHSTNTLIVDKGKKGEKSKAVAQNNISTEKSSLAPPEEANQSDNGLSLVDAKDQHIIDDTNIEKPKSAPSQIATGDTIGDKVGDNFEDNFDIEGYSKLVLLKIKEKLEYPFVARRRNLEGDVKILVTVNSDGELSDLKILESSGFKILDENVIKSAKNIKMDEKPPRDIEFPLIISYRLN
jgi:TonB family protein